MDPLDRLRLFAKLLEAFDKHLTNQEDRYVEQLFGQLSGTSDTPNAATGKDSVAIDSANEGTTNQDLPIIACEEAKDYALFSQIKAQHLPANFPVTDKKLRSFLRLNCDIRQGNPPGKTSERNKQKLLVHIGDFVRNLPELKQWVNAQNDIQDDPVEIMQRTELIRARKQRGSRQPTSRQLPG